MMKFFQANMATNSNNPKTSSHRESKKRSRPDENEETFSTDTIIWPRHIIISGEGDNNLEKVSPFAVTKFINVNVGNVKNIKRLRSGDFLVEVASKKQSDALLKVTNFIGIPVQTSPHKSLNTKKGVVRSSDLRHESEESLLSEFKTQGVTGVKRISIQKDGVRQETKTLILSFGTPTLPSHISAGYLKLPVSLFIPNPLRCFKCQKFGHHKDQCRQTATCPKCSEKDHGDTSCSKPNKCRNCEGNHPSYSKDCPSWNKEKTISKIKTESDITFPEARRLFEQQQTTPAGQKTFAQAATVVTKPQTSVCSVEVQTNLTWPEFSPFYTDLSEPIVSFDTKTTSTTSTSKTTSGHQTQTSTIPSTPKSPTCAQPTRNSPEPAKIKAGPKSFKDKNAGKKAAKSAGKPAVTAAEKPAKRKQLMDVDPCDPLTETSHTYRQENADDLVVSDSPHIALSNEEWYAQQRALGFKIMSP
jgi:hypothetical protein